MFIKEKGVFVKKGFTLAEVLITLAIIGVVAALTIPSVVRNYQKTQTVTKLKKTYSALANTTNLAIADHGPVTEWEVGEDGTGQAAIDFANTYMIPYLKVSKNCETKTTGDCAFYYSQLNDNIQRSSNSTYTRFYLNDGVFIALSIENGIRENGLNYRLVRMHIDINGQKKPNKFGKDIFFFRYYIFTGTQSSPYNGKFLPYSYNSSRDVLSGKTASSEACGKEGNGYLCAALILKDGWRISDDYPWN